MIDPQKIRPPHFLLALLLLAIGAQVLFGPVGIVPYFFRWVGVVVSIVGLSLMTLAHQLFKKHDTPVPHSEKPRQVVAEGVFRYSRNPMYVGGAMIFLGVALMVRTWPFFVAWALMGMILNWIYVPWEEKRMEALFGEEYRSYTKQTRRWI